MSVLVANDQSDGHELLKQREDFLAGVSDAGRPEAVAKQRKGGWLTARSGFGALR